MENRTQMERDEEWLEQKGQKRSEKTKKNKTKRKIKQWNENYNQNTGDNGEKSTICDEIKTNCKNTNKAKKKE